MDYHNFSTIETFLKNRILPDLDRGRPNFDKLHIQVVVIKLKQILKNTPKLKIDKRTLLIAAYAHDWGYTDLFEKKKFADYELIQDAKEKHMKIGSQKIATLLKDKIFSSLLRKQKQRIIHLVKVHDNLNLLHDEDELILMEADTLGGLDISLVKSTFDQVSNHKYLQKVRKERLPRFVTKFGAKEAQRLIKLRTDYYHLKTASFS